MRSALLMSTALLACASHAFAANDPIKVSMNMVDEKGMVSSAGEIVITASPYGLVFTPSLTNLPAGVHGFHIHENPSCDPAVKDGKAVAALAAGGHWDPNKTGKHAGPAGDGHKGDLPALYAAADGKASYAVVAPRLNSLDEVRGHALMLHAGGDNHEDHPMPLGGGGARMVCGVIR
jgi:superoxide dismutase, Cu-Zn family